MPAPRSTNRTMFWRIVRRLLGANRGRLFVILLALGAGAAVTAALLNLQVDAQRRLTTEFRAFGPNIVVAPMESAASSDSQATLDQSSEARVPSELNGRHVQILPVLFLVADVYADSSQNHRPVVVAGKTGGFLTATVGDKEARLPIQNRLSPCSVGVRVAAQMHLQSASELRLKNAGRSETCSLSFRPPTGGAEDDQIAVPLAFAQTLAALTGRVSLIEINAPGRPDEVANYLIALRKSLPGISVRPIRQFTEGEARIYTRISGVLSATVGVILILTALCVMAAMTNVAMERRNDVGLMKALGGATRRVLRLFLVEAALLGLASGVFGGALGILLSVWLGKTVFGVAAQPRLIVYPLAVALTVLVAIMGAFPLRRLANIRPASVFRGEA
jgi:putative ABC transport system permease protein